MNIPSLTSIFKKKKKKLIVPDTILIKKLKALSSQSNLLVYKDITIYHHTDAFFIPLMVIDPLRGIYLFESKEWTYDELKNADIQKAQKQDDSENTLAFENKHDIIRKKFNELTHSDGVPIFNYLLMEYLSADEYEHLSDSFKELLPKEKIIFSDAQEADIFKKLQAASSENETLLSVDEILGTLFIQYALLRSDDTFCHASKEQRAFIDKELEDYSELLGLPRSGKSSILLLKAVVELLNDASKKIVIIKPTIFACDILKKKLLEIVEHAIVEIDLTSIEILTPLELINRHQKKLKREPLAQLFIDAKLMKKSFKVADIILCDDAQLYSIEFHEYLKHIQKHERLLLTYTESDSTDNLQFTHSFENPEKKVSFYQTNPHAKAMHLIYSLLERGATNIVIASNALSMERLKEDLDSFIEENVLHFDSSQRLINQNFSNLLLSEYKDLSELTVHHIILMDLCFSSENEIKYALHLAKKSVTILYEEDCLEIQNLRKTYEKSNQK